MRRCLHKYMIISLLTKEIFVRMIEPGKIYANQRVKDKVKVKTLGARVQRVMEGATSTKAEL